MRFTTALSLLLASAGVAHAFDDFIVYNLPPQVNMTQFANAFDSVCMIWPAAIADGQTLVAAIVSPPIHGDDPLNSVRAGCAWSNGTEWILYTEDIASILGATVV
ncbi:hypothetical protein GGX14DRAFT_620828, partial [Mycena pura]